MQLLDNIYIW